MSPPPTGLRLSAALVIGFGLFMLLATVPPLKTALSFLADMIFWPLDGVQDPATPAARLLTAICGGLAMGWGVLIWGLSGDVFLAKPETVRRLVLRSYAAWFVADGVASLAAGAPLNLIGNTMFLLALWWPIRAPLPEAARS